MVGEKMMNALSSIRQAGFDVALDDDCFSIKPASKLTDGQRLYLKVFKPEIMGQLREETKLKNYLINLPNITPNVDK
jgi:hypothetical protein